MKELKLKKIKSVLFIHHMLAMGEVVLLTGIYEAIRQNLPQVQLSIIAKEYACNFLRTLPYFKLVTPIENFGVYAHKPKIYIFSKMLSFFFKNRYDCIIWRDDKRLPYNSIFKFAITLSRTKQTINFGPLLVKHLQPNSHIFEIYGHILEEIGFEVGKEVKPKLEVSEEALIWAEKFLAKMGVDKKKDKIIGICPISNLEIKNWKKENVSLLINKLLSKNKNIKILLFSSQEFPVKDIIKIGFLSFQQLKALIKSCDVFVSVDTGPMHTASALGVPIIALFGPTSGSVFGPRSEGSIIIKKKMPCPYYNPYTSLLPYSNPDNCYAQDKCLWREESCINLISVEDF